MPVIPSPVDGIDLQVRPGEVYGVLGPNGAGKTTTLSMLATLLRIAGALLAVVLVAFVVLTIVGVNPGNGVAQLVAEGAGRPAAVLGIPVGFVGAVESKQALAESPHELEHLVVRGRRGGSALTAAAINAMASEEA